MIRCQEVMERVSASLLGGEPRDERVVRHLEGCNSCRDESRELDRTWRLLGELAAPEPGSGFRRRFEAMLAEEIARSESRSGRDVETTGSSWRDRLVAFWSRPGHALALGSAVAALVVGLVGGAFVASRGPDPQVQGLRTQVAELHEMVALSLLEQESASRRLQGVRYGTEAGRPRPPLQDALIQAVDRDPNVNVRLAALDALTPVAGERAVMNRLLRSLPRQDSPLVQIAMIDLLLEADGAQARRVAGQVGRDPELPEEVRRHIRERLRSGGRTEKGRRRSE